MCRPGFYIKLARGEGRFAPLPSRQLRRWLVASCISAFPFTSAAKLTVARTLLGGVSVLVYDALSVGPVKDKLKLSQSFHFVFLAVSKPPDLPHLGGCSCGRAFPRHFQPAAVSLPQRRPVHGATLLIAEQALFGQSLIAPFCVFMCNKSNRSPCLS